MVSVGFVIPILCCCCCCCFFFQQRKLYCVHSRSVDLSLYFIRCRHLIQTHSTQHTAAVSCTISSRLSISIATQRAHRALQSWGPSKNEIKPRRTLLIDKRQQCATQYVCHCVLGSVNTMRNKPGTMRDRTLLDSIGSALHCNSMCSVYEFFCWQRSCIEKKTCPSCLPCPFYVWEGWHERGTLRINI